MKHVRRVGAIALTVAMLAMIGGAVSAAESDLVDINLATTRELESLPQVGPALAKRIVDFREIHGAFKSVDDLLKVQGIGEKTLAKLRDWVTVSRAKS